jgi:NAD(P)-dependent dehydrogenase (short-subunit alcohol dehydrogenase family)
MAESMNLEVLFGVAGKVVVVTGGSRGIGRMIAQGFVENGAQVVISARKAEACDATARELSALGACASVPADLSTGDGRKRLVDAVAAQHGKLDVLVNNAGANWGAPIEEYPEDGYDKVMDVNVKSVFFLTQGFLPLLEGAASAEDPARIINIGSIDGLKVPGFDNYAYSASKAAVHHMTRVLAVRLRGRHVTVNALAPGPFESKMTEWMLGNFQEKIEKGCPLGRIGAPSDMAGASIFLASRAGSYINGAVIPVDGGICIT